MISYSIEERLTTILSCSPARACMMSSFIGEDSALKEYSGGDDSV